jgi:hypothetical protein
MLKEFTLRRNLLIWNIISTLLLLPSLKKFHGVVNALCVTVRNGQISRSRCSHAKQESVVVRPQVVGRYVRPNGDASDKVDAFGRKEVDSSLDDLFGEFHGWNTVLEKTSDAIGTLVNCDQMSSFVQLIGGCKTTRSGSNNSNPLSSPDAWRNWLNPSHSKGLVYDGALDVLDGDWRLIDAEDAGTFAWSWANATSELGEVVSLQQLIQSLSPVITENLK